ncbi:Transposase from transposon Tn916 [bacterium HR27]|nr:Transposase from transposon Tn916 [bacterium HR27]
MPTVPETDNGRKRRRRGSGEGTVFFDQRRGKWVAQLSVPDPVRGRLRRISRIADTQREALKLLQKLREEHERGVLAHGRPPTLGQFLHQWLEGRRPSLRPRTLDTYETVIRSRIVPVLGSLTLDKVTPAALQAAYSQLLARGLAPRSVVHAHRLLHRAFEDAVKWGLLGRNPCDLVDPPHAPRPTIQPFSLEEVRVLLAACADDPIGPLVTVAVLTGMRLGELLGLQWGDIDWERGELSVARAIQRSKGRGLITVEPKTATSRRRVPLPPQALEALRVQRRRQLEQRLAAGPAWADGDWVFTTSLGTPISPSDAHHAYQRLLERAWLPRRRFHDLRHTTATLLLTDGVHPKVVASLLGHSTIQLTLDTYSHVTPGLAHEAAGRLGALIANSIANSNRAAPEDDGD